MKALGLCVVLYAVTVLLLFVVDPCRWLSRCAWYRCVVNWQLYRRWTPCLHRAIYTRLMGPALPAISDAELWESGCQDCGTVFLRDTRANWDKAMARVAWGDRLLTLLFPMKRSAK
jgi:hypothetical protein